MKLPATGHGLSPTWLRLLRRVVPPTVLWSGAGVIVNKLHRDGQSVSAQALIFPRAPVRGVVSGYVRPRWLLVVRDNQGNDHFVNVEQEVWERHEIGDDVSAAHPLVEVS